MSTQEQGPEQGPEIPPFIAATPLEVLHTADESVVRIGTVSNIKSDDDRREMLAAGLGLTPDEVVPADSDHRIASRARRLSVGFRRWNSPWDPHADKQPENPELN